MHTAMNLNPVRVQTTGRPWQRATSAMKSEVTTVLTTAPWRPFWVQR